MQNFDREKFKQWFNIWFETTDFEKRNIWNTDDIAKLIKDKLKSIRAFKARPRGDPRKGFKVMNEIKAIKKVNGIKTNDDW